MRSTLATLVDDWRRHGNQTAVVRLVGNRRVRTSYAALAELAGRFSAELKKRNIAPGERVLLWGENSAEWIAAFFGCVLRGVLVVPLDAAGSAEFAQRVIEDVQPVLVVGDRSLSGALPLNLAKLDLSDLAAILPEEEAAAEAGLSAETPLQILFTSGTTGNPKGVVHTHGNVLASLEPIEREMQKYLRFEKLVHPLRFLHTLPLSHVFGQFMGLWIPALLAAEVHFDSRLAALRLVETIRRERISVLAAVPRVLQVLKTHLENEEPSLGEAIQRTKLDPAWKRWWKYRSIHRAFGLKFWAFVCEGASLSPDLEQFWNALGFVLVQGYGMTETAALITVNHPFHISRGSVGKPLPGREVKLGPDGEVLVRGPMVSPATWHKGQLQQRESPWLATGDLAEQLPSGELRFLGRKSEVIVTSSGLNIHPEDLEAALQEEPGIHASAVVAVDTPNGREPLAVLAFHGAPSEVGHAIQQTNPKLAEFQRIRRWVLWPEPYLPRTSTGKVQRRRVALWVQANSMEVSKGESVAGQDWLLTLIQKITGELPQRTDDQARLEEDLHLDSLGRVQLASALEQELGSLCDEEQLQQAGTLGELRSLVGLKSGTDGSLAFQVSVTPEQKQAPERSRKFSYPHWTLNPLAQWVRVDFLEAVVFPLVRLWAAPKIFSTELNTDQRMLLIANHVTAFDVPILLSSLPRGIRERVAVAMAGEMLDDWRHSQNQPTLWHKLLAPAAYWLVTELFNVFPLPRSAGFQRSFAHAGEALDRGYHVLVFPEGSRSPEGLLRNFRRGIGVLAQQAKVPVLPIALIGLGELKVARKGWYRSGKIQVRVGRPIVMQLSLSPDQITKLLEEEVKSLLQL
jgi:long-chain acyl-CoA synthetase